MFKLFFSLERLRGSSRSFVTLIGVLLLVPQLLGGLISWVKMAEEAAAAAADEMIQVQPTFPSGRIKRIMKLDKDISKINSEALFLVSCSLDLFIESLCKRCAQVAIERKRKTVNLEHLRIAVKRHQPTSDFLLDSLPLPSTISPASTSRSHHNHQLPPATTRIDHFFHKAP